MSLAQLVPLAIQVSMAMLIFAVGLGVDPGEWRRWMSRPGLLVRAVLAMNVAMPALALGLVLWLDLEHALEVALVALALAPVPPILPGKELKAGGRTSSILGVFVATAVMSIVFVPTATHLLGRWLERPIDVPTATIAWIVLTSMLLPLGAAILLRSLAPASSAKLAHPISIAGSVLLAAAFVPIIVAQWPRLVALASGATIAVTVLFVVAGLVLGHALGGPDPDDRSVLALSTATRHPAVALAIAHDAQDRSLVLTAVLLVLLIGGVLSGPYVKWRRRRHDAAIARQRSTAS